MKYMFKTNRFEWVKFETPKWFDILTFNFMFKNGKLDWCILERVVLAIWTLLKWVLLVAACIGLVVFAMWFIPWLAEHIAQKPWYQP